MATKCATGTKMKLVDDPQGQANKFARVVGGNDMNQWDKTQTVGEEVIESSIRRRQELFKRNRCKQDMWYGLDSGKKRWMIDARCEY